ncbi:hypothetical protein A1O3_01175 [Capronia epimyces CBS 606.96]|uniref:FAD dependent oxidoreductase domain-containing protein n=1 Tax=Capronia epimyces CBS 606.96 TaxID=1182542 RepID=W9YJA2_9EURO|nr:uncharacterized protein A1O3_01175 [Capronia epimyces CBS 606.96]EXJ92623.1 hypothetical protein A1O3_01175 [Capronia epimyces CBS 606.96]
MITRLSEPPIRRVAVIGAGVSGVSTAAHLIAEGLDVTVFERAPVSGGVWVLDPNIPFEPAYPAPKASVAESTFYDLTTESDNPHILHSSPGPAYEGLKNNVPTPLMELSLNSYKPNTDLFVSQRILAEYIQDTAAKTGVAERTLHDTKVEHLSKEPGESEWTVRTSTWDHVKKEKSSREWKFDAVAVASGHYHAPKVPNIPGLVEWKRAFPTKVQHSKRFRNPKGFDNQTILVIGGSASSTDIARELGPTAKKIWQSTRKGKYDTPVSMLPENATRVAEIASFSPLPEDIDGSGSGSGPIPGTVTLVDGQVLENIDRVIVATGYLFTLPFAPQYHRDDLSPQEADDKVLITDGLQMHNLHDDIFYIPDPTLAFVGVPFFVATFSFFEFQAIAVAAYFAGLTTLPSEAEMREEYKKRVEADGYGKKFHIQQGRDLEYVSRLMAWVNKDLEPSKKKTDGYSEKWIATRDALFKEMTKPGGILHDPSKDEVE